MSGGVVDQSHAGQESSANGAEGTTRGLTIGSVCRELRSEFPDVSISKIRYLEDQKLVSPRRTTGGYRLFSSDDLNRLRTVLRAQRDMFLPLRVIRNEIAAGKIKVENLAGSNGLSAEDRVDGLYTLEQIFQQTGASHRLLSELEAHGIVERKSDAEEKIYDDTDRQIITAAVELAQYGVAGKNLRLLKRSADQEAALLEQILAPALRSKNESRRKKARDSLECLAAEMTKLKQQLLLKSLEEVINKKG